MRCAALQVHMHACSEARNDEQRKHSATRQTSNCTLHADDVSMLAKLKRSSLQCQDIMGMLREACDSIMSEHHSGHTECVYEKLLSQYFYERSIPFLTQVDCFIQKSSTQVYVGRLDIEIAHSTIVELKVGQRVKQADIDQLMKYVRAKRACGMKLQNAAVVCFRTDNTVEIVNFTAS